MKKIVHITLIIMSLNAISQNKMSPELLWKLGRITTLGISKDGKNVIYEVHIPSIEENKLNSKYYSLPLNGGNPINITSPDDYLKKKKTTLQMANTLFTMKR